jgi:hypothetical protein
LNCQEERRVRRYNFMAREKNQITSTPHFWQNTAVGVNTDRAVIDHGPGIPRARDQVDYCSHTSELCTILNVDLCPFELARAAAVIGGQNRAGRTWRGAPEESSGKIASGSPCFSRSVASHSWPQPNCSELPCGQPSAMGKDVLQSEMPNWRVKNCKVIPPPPRRFQIPNSKPVSSCRHATRHFSSDELGIFGGGLSRGVVELWS